MVEILENRAASRIKRSITRLKSKRQEESDGKIFSQRKIQHQQQRRFLPV
jgi:hypothetical protein